MSHLLKWLTNLSMVFLAGCVSPAPPLNPSPTGLPPSPHGGKIFLTTLDAEAIGKKIWRNECAGTVEGLTTWNSGEDFPSLGIGHFIWYVEGRPGPFDESFPKLISYMEANQVRVPQWVIDAPGSPWQLRTEFDDAKHSPQMRELRQFLADTVIHQTNFIVLRLEEALPKMKAATKDATDRKRLEETFYKVASSRTGVYALIDYVNFKGEGIKAEEKYNGVGWGLRDVILEMGETPDGNAAAEEFSEAAKRTLKRRIINSPPSRGESRWEAGWMNRCESYKHGF
ncbi:MAG: hypothetical protein CMO61_00565 [Verrucomicrobiales bacterium]|jgi:hypothetical protein|nr:hypothetical protein [Verrucomicrobiales bacterium]|tara:strand:+ start:35962 stop:36813 length:852 start_codon:yes stop_codon:yes gene_type:complete